MWWWFYNLAPSPVRSPSLCHHCLKKHLDSSERLWYNSLVSLFFNSSDGFKPRDDHQCCYKVLRSGRTRKRQQHVLRSTCPSLLIYTAPGLLWRRQQYCMCLEELVSRCWLPTGPFVWLLKGFCNSLFQDNARDNVMYAVIIRDQWTGVISAWKNKNMFFGNWSIVVGASRNHPHEDGHFKTPDA